MSNHEKSNRGLRKYFGFGDGKDELTLLFYSSKSLKRFHFALGTLLRENFPEGPGEGLCFSLTGTLKDHHP